MIREISDYAREEVKKIHPDAKYMPAYKGVRITTPSGLYGITIGIGESESSAFLDAKLRLEDDVKPLHYTFTPRELSILLLMADGHRGESVADQLGISRETVKRHVYGICQKVGVNSSLEAVSWYYKTYWSPKAELVARKTVSSVR